MSDALRRAALYGAAAALVWGGARAHSALSAAAARPAPIARPPATEGPLGRRPLHAALREAGCSPAEAAALAALAGRSLDARRLRPDDRFRLARGDDGRLLHLTLTHGRQRAVVTIGPQGLRTRARLDPVAAVERRAAGEVRGSLWPSMAAAGVPAEVIARFAEAFQWTVDFLAETRDGDRFAVAWTETSARGRVLGRTVEAGAYEGPVAGRRTAVLFDGEYYDAAGESLRRMFLRAPLKFARVSSRFDGSRRHPILRVNRPHHGTDYAAPPGTPVSVVADGVVTAARRERGFGNVVKVRHDSTYSTLYAHLSRFGAGMRAGARVKQGRVIGYVGSTGLATGPHLHFQIEKNGRWADFLALDLPFARSVPRARRAEFAGRRDALLPGLPAPASTAASRSRGAPRAGS